MKILLSSRFILGLLLISTGVVSAQSVPADSILTLARALDLAVQNYPSIKNKLTETEATKADLAARKASFLPVASFQAQALYATSNNVRGAAFPNEGSTNSVSSGIKANGPTTDAVWGSLSSLNVNWKAITFGRNKAELALSKSAIQRAAADYQQELFVHQVRVADAYLMALIIDQTVKVQSANLARIESFRTVMQANTRSGRRPGVDSVLADAEQAKARLLLIESRRMAQQQRVQLGEFMGLPGSAFQLDTTTFQASVPPDFQFSADKLANHPVLAFYRRQIDFSQARAEAIRKSYLPAISLNGSFWARGSGISDNTTPEGNFIYNSSLGAGLPFRVANYFVGVSTFWRFSDVFRTRQETKARVLRTQGDQYQYDQEVLRIRVQQQTADLQIQNAYEAAQQAPVQLGAARAAYEQAQARYTAGLSNVYEFTQGFTLLNRAEIDQFVTTNNVWRALLLKSAAAGDLTDFIKLTRNNPLQMNKLIASALTRPVTIVVLVLGILVFSVMAVLNIPVDIFPKLNAPTIYIAQSYGGMMPSQMEGFIATRYQNQMLYVSGVKDVDVKNVQGLTLVKCSFYENTNMAQAAGEVANQVSRVLSYLPPGSQPPVVVRFDASTLPVGQLVFNSKTRSLSEIQDLASTKIRPLLAKIPGASSPPPFGGNERTVVIKVDPAKMQSYALTPDQIVQSVVKANQISPAGVVRMKDYAYMTPSNSVINTVSEFAQIPLKMGTGPTVLLGDVATVNDAADQTVGYALVNGKRAVYIPVTKTGDASTMAVVTALKAKLAEMQSLLPDDVRLSYEFDQSVYVSNAVSGLMSEGIIGAVLTGLTVLLFLRDWRSSLIVVLTIPVAILASVMLLNAAGQTINIMTLSGLALAIGILVDEATVTIENIHQHLEMGKSKARAIYDACLEIAFPEFLILICILAVFAPSFLMSGVPKAMFLPLSLSIGFAMIVAFFLALTLVPVLSNWWMKSHHKGDHEEAVQALNQQEVAQVESHAQHEKTTKNELKGFEKFKARYVSLVELLLRHRTLVISGYVLITFGLAGLLFMNIGQDMLPKSNAKQFQVRIIAPQGMRIERTEERVQRVLGIIEQLVGKDNVEISSAFVGMTPSSYGTSNLYVFNAGPHEATVQVALNEGYTGNMDVLRDKLRAEVKKQLPGVGISYEPIELTDKIMSQGASTPIEVQVGGKSLEDGQAYARRLLDGLKSIHYLRDIRIKQPLNYPTLDIQFDRIKAAQFGLTADDISKSLVAATSSSRFTAKNLWLDRKTGYAYQVQVQLPEYEMSSPEDMENIPLVKGQLRPTLGDVATIRRTTVPGEYDRSGPRRLVTVSANIFNKDLGTATRDVQQIIDGLGAPPKGTVVELQGMAQLLRETLGSLQTGLGLAIVVIFLVLMANFQSFGVAFVVLSTIPAVLAGSLGLLTLTGSTLNLQSYMGIIMSVGVSVANAILLITNAEQLRLVYNDSTKAALTAGGMRLRPIMMTSMAMIAGMIPMASGLGEAGDQSAPLGRAVIGGLFFSAFAALLILPVIFASVQGKASVKSSSLNPNDEESEFYDGVDPLKKQLLTTHPN